MINLMHGDCLEMMRQIPDGSVDMILTDIPYGEVNRKSSGLRNLDKGDADIITFSLKDAINESVRLAKQSIYLFCGTGQVSEIRSRMVDAGLSTRLCCGVL